jgi:hypothetical protein
MGHHGGLLGRQQFGPKTLAQDKTIRHKTLGVALIKLDFALYSIFSFFNRQKEILFQYTLFLTMQYMYTYTTYEF